jgi:putative ABC transport system permease protein
MQVSLPDQHYADAEKRLSFYNQLVDRVGALPGVTRVGGISNLPMSGSTTSHSIERIGQTAFPQGKQPQILWSPVTPGYFEAIGTRLIQDRSFTSQDRSDSQPVALVNKGFVNKFFRGQDPIGQQFAQPGRPPISIIGVTDDVMNEDFDDKLEPQIYAPYAQGAGRSMYLVIRSVGDPAQLTSAVRREVSALDKMLPVFNVKPMSQVIDERLSPKRLATAMMAVFALVALALAGVGIYAVMSYVVSQRTHEIGVRMALGAQPRDIFTIVIAQGLMLTLAGVAIGLAGAYAMTRGMAGLLYGVTTTDPLTFIGIPILLGGVAMLACYVPTRRATRVDPMIALRHE